MALAFKHAKAAIILMLSFAALVVAVTRCGHWRERNA
jgi:hypothetical protein